MKSDWSQRLKDIGRFYKLLEQLESKCNGKRLLNDCHGRMKWTARGVYFFFELGELRTGFYEFHLKEWLVARQSYLSWHETSKNKYLPAMQPDLVLVEKKTGKRVVLDTKFTAASLARDSWGGVLFISSHLYHIYTYLKTQEHMSEQHRLATGILLYPAAKEGRISEKILLQGQTIRVETIDLTALWQDIERSLLDLIEAPIAVGNKR